MSVYFNPRYISAHLYLLPWSISQHLPCGDTGDNVGIVFTDSEVAVEGIVVHILGGLLVVVIVLSSDLVVGLSVVDSINIIEK